MKHVSGSLTVAEAITHPLDRIHDTPQEEYSQRETILTMMGVLLVMLLASLDQTIVSTALPRIIADLNGFDRYTWVSTAYLLTSTVTVPIYGELSDLFGRKPIFLFGVVIFLLGSALSGTAQTMNGLIAFRAFQGLGAGALIPIAIAIVGDLFTPRERGRWQGVTGAVFALSSIVGPTAGGWITQNASWRWVFYVNLPIGVVALLVLIFLMPTIQSRKQHTAIDYVGAALLIISATTLLLGFTWAGSLYPWLSPQILGLFAVAIITTVYFVLYESRLAHRGGEPVLDPGLFTNSIFTISIIVTIFFGMGLFGSIFFIPLFVQGVTQTSAANSGLILTPLLLTAVVGSIIVGQLVSRLGRYKVFAISGIILSLAGSVLLIRLDIHSTNTDVLVGMLVLGAGMGFSMALYSVIVQNALPTRIGQATAALTFFRSIGQTIGLAAMGSVMLSAYTPAFNNALPSTAKQVFPASFLAAFNNPEVLLSSGSQEQLRTAATRFGPQGTALLNPLLNAMKIGLVQGIHSVFVLSLAVMCISFVAVLFLKEIPLRGKRDVPSSMPGAVENTASASG